MKNWIGYKESKALLEAFAKRGIVPCDEARLETKVFGHDLDEAGFAEPDEEYVNNQMNQRSIGALNRISDTEWNFDQRFTELRQFVYIVRETEKTKDDGIYAITARPLMRKEMSSRR
ncbi:MAG TPA: hypothetical protein VJC07_02585 [Candidatus Nanoarchaeia archaeon]|nr:hypothetical protein [Candidatus Nanoarchaeia archaeon]